MYILGVDLAFSNCGLAFTRLSEGELEVLETYTITTTPKESLLEKSGELFLNLTAAIEQISFNGEMVIAVEIPAGSQSAHAAKALAAATAVFGCIKKLYPDITFIEFTPRNIKEFVGQKEIKGAARKVLNIEKVGLLYPNAPLKRNKKGEVLRKEEHACDAILLAHLAKDKL